jgi:hypothetical protein
MKNKIKQSSRRTKKSSPPPHGITDVQASPGAIPFRARIAPHDYIDRWVTALRA